MTQRENQHRWAVDQQRKARAAYARSISTVEAERADKLVGLRSLAALLKNQPGMEATLAAVLDQIVNLEKGGEP